MKLITILYEHLKVISNNFACFLTTFFIFLSELVFIFCLLVWFSLVDYCLCSVSVEMQLLLLFLCIGASSAFSLITFKHIRTFQANFASSSYKFNSITESREQKDNYNSITNKHIKSKVGRAQAVCLTAARLVTSCTFAFTCYTGKRKVRIYY